MVALSFSCFISNLLTGRLYRADAVLKSKGRHPACPFLLEGSYFFVAVATADAAAEADADGDGTTVGSAVGAIVGRSVGTIDGSIVGAGVLALQPHSSTATNTKIAKVRVISFFFIFFTFLVDSMD